MEEILKRLAVIETRFEERWLAHDKNSNIRWSELSRQLDNLAEITKGLVTCKEYDEHKNNINQRIAWIWGAIGGVSLTIAGLFIQHLGGK